MTFSTIPRTGKRSRQYFIIAVRILTASVTAFSLDADAVANWDDDAHVTVPPSYSSVYCSAIASIALQELEESGLLAYRSPIFVGAIVADSLKPTTTLYVGTEQGGHGETEVMNGNLCIALSQKVWLELGAIPTPGVATVDPSVPCSAEVGLSVLAHELFHVHPTGGSPLGANQHVLPTLADGLNLPLKRALKTQWKQIEEVNAVHAQLCRLLDRCNGGVLLDPPGSTAGATTMRNHLQTLKSYSRQNLDGVAVNGNMFELVLGASPAEVAAFNNWRTRVEETHAANCTKITQITQGWNL